MPITPTEKIWMNGQLVDWADARIHVLTHTLHYGTGVFEGIRAYATDAGAAVFRLGDHTRRLYRSAALYHMDLPWSEEGIVAATGGIAAWFPGAVPGESRGCHRSLAPLQLRGHRRGGLTGSRGEVPIRLL